MSIHRSTLSNTYDLSKILGKEVKAVKPTETEYGFQYDITFQDNKQTSICLIDKIKEEPKKSLNSFDRIYLGVKK